MHLISEYTGLTCNELYRVDIEPILDVFCLFRQVLLKVYLCECMLDRDASYVRCMLDALTNCARACTS